MAATTPASEEASSPSARVEADLAAMQWEADPHADDAVEAIMGPWPQDAGSAAPEIAVRLRRIDDVNAAMRAWQDNAHVASWRGTAVDAGLRAPLERYVEVARALPPWAEVDRIRRA